MKDGKWSDLWHATAFTLVFSVCLFEATWAQPGQANSHPSATGTVAQSVLEYDLEQCLEIAMATNHRRPASQFAVAMAEAQHKQALAGYWPHLHLNAGYQRMDEPPNFLYPPSALYVPPQNINLPAGAATVTIPAGAFGNPAPIQLPVNVPAQNINVPAQIQPIPEYEVKMMDKDSWLTSVTAKWLLYDGGMRKGLREQTKGWLEAVKQEARRTDLAVRDTVIRMYHGAVLARQLLQVGNDTLARMDATLNLTETMYKEGAGTVKKTDYLDNKIMVESLRSAVALLEKNEEMSQAALANAMGLTWDTTVKPKTSTIPFEPHTMNMGTVVSTAFRFSPDWAQLEAGIRAVEGKVRHAKSGYYPKLAVTGEVHRWWNDYDYGVATDENKEGWSAGVGVEFPLFEGFLTRNKVRAARARLDKIKEERFLLREGIGLHVRDIILGLTAAAKRYQATLDAMESAEENRKLNTRAYQNELVETEDVIRAQLVEALMSAQHYRMRFDHVALKSQLNLVVGTEIREQLKGKR